MTEHVNFCRWRKSPAACVNWTSGCCAWCVDNWRSGGVAVPPVPVNFSAHHFHETGAVAKLARILEETGALGENLMLEISEHVTHQDSAGVESALNALRELGREHALGYFFSKPVTAAEVPLHRGMWLK